MKLVVLLSSIALLIFPSYGEPQQNKDRKPVTQAKVPKEVMGAKKSRDPKKALSDKSNLLDFEAEVIEGKKQGPDLFFETGSAPVAIEAILLKRHDFNEFHLEDHKERLHYWPPQKSLK